jgi:hypothetical protein
MAHGGCQPGTMPLLVMVKVKVSEGLVDSQDNPTTPGLTPTAEDYVTRSLYCCSGLAVTSTAVDLRTPPIWWSAVALKLRADKYKQRVSHHNHDPTNPALVRRATNPSYIEILLPLRSYSHAKARISQTIPQQLRSSDVLKTLVSPASRLDCPLVPVSLP